jgi:hypothetical protein
MRRSYYEGIPLDYKAQNYDDEYSLKEYCRKYCKEYTPSCCSDTIFTEGDECIKPDATSFWTCLMYILPFWGENCK